MARDILANDETYALIAADKVAGTAVFNQDGEKVGSIYNVMIDKRSGRVTYAVMSFGGFLGIGERYHALPWQVLHYDPSKGGYIVGLSRQQLEAAPTFARNEEPDFDDPVWGTTVHRHYGVTPWWPQPIGS